MKKFIFILGLVFAAASFNNSNCMNFDQIQGQIQSTSASIDHSIQQIDGFLQNPMLTSVEEIIAPLTEIQVQFQVYLERFEEISALLLSEPNAEILAQIQTKYQEDVILVLDIQDQLKQIAQLIQNIFGAN